MKIQSLENTGSSTSTSYSSMATETNCMELTTSQTRTNSSNKLETDVR